jgi:hypothetical protein
MIKDTDQCKKATKYELEQQVRGQGLKQMVMDQSATYEVPPAGAAVILSRRR